jgi:hypothetical protein
MLEYLIITQCSYENYRKIDDYLLIGSRESKRTIFTWSSRLNPGLLFFSHMRTIFWDVFLLNVLLFYVMLLWIQTRHDATCFKLWKQIFSPVCSDSKVSLSETRNGSFASSRSSSSYYIKPVSQWLLLKSRARAREETSFLFPDHVTRPDPSIIL